MYLRLHCGRLLPSVRAHHPSRHYTHKKIALSRSVVEINSIYKSGPGARESVTHGRAPRPGAMNVRRFRIFWLRGTHERFIELCARVSSDRSGRGRFTAGREADPASYGRAAGRGGPRPPAATVGAPVGRFGRRRADRSAGRLALRRPADECPGATGPRLPGAVGGARCPGNCDGATATSPGRCSWAATASGAFGTCA